MTVTTLPSLATAQTPDLFGGMRWRQIGPTRAGRARALSGSPGQPNVFYIGFDNGGVWRSTDYGANWEPLFDSEATGSIGAIAVAPSNPNIIYVGSGAGIIRPDLATGHGIYAALWQQQQAFYEGSAYGGTSGGIFKSTDGGTTWRQLKDGLPDVVQANLALAPSNPKIVYAIAAGAGPSRGGQTTVSVAPGPV